LVGARLLCSALSFFPSVWVQFAFRVSKKIGDSAEQVVQVTGQGSWLTLESSYFQLNGTSFTLIQAG